ncbi:MAG TPA: hypothetical protein VM598_00895 [Bdellovibrionota bacterium]|nr:hypothetical protein [Bdellovibrionota bacterium]
MRLRDQYDWVVLGDHPGALLSASLAARLGLSVLVLPFAPGARLIVSGSGQHFDPEPNFMLGLAAADQPDQGVATGLLGLCLKRLGVLASEEELIEVKGCFHHVLTPSARVSLAPQPEKFEGELKRELGEERVKRLGLLAALKGARPELGRYWAELPRRLTMDPARKGKVASAERLAQVYRRLGHSVRATNRSAQAWLVKDHRVSDLMRLHPEMDLEDICRGLWHGVSTSGIHDPELPDFLQAISLANSAGAYRGGMTAYREFMLRLARRAGADIPPKTDCRRIFVEAGRLVGIQVSNHGNMISTPAGVLGCSLEHVSQKVTASGATLFRKLRPAPKPSGWRFSISLTVHAEAIPAVTPSRLVWQEKDAPAILIEIVDPADYGHKEADHRILFARTILPFTPETLTVPFQRMTGARMFRQLTEIFPFLEFHVKRVFPDFRTGGSTFVQAKAPAADAGAEFLEAYPYATLEEIPENLRAYSGPGMGARSGVEGLFVASGESFPELGSLGPTVAAIESVAWLAHRAGLPGPFA